MCVSYRVDPGRVSFVLLYGDFCGVCVWSCEGVGDVDSFFLVESFCYCSHVCLAVVCCCFVERFLVVRGGDLRVRVRPCRPVRFFVRPLELFVDGRGRADGYGLVPRPSFEVSCGVFVVYGVVVVLDECALPRVPIPQRMSDAQAQVRSFRHQPQGVLLSFLHEGDEQHATGHREGLFRLLLTHHPQQGAGGAVQLHACGGHAAGQTEGYHAGGGVGIEEQVTGGKVLHGGDVAQHVGGAAGEGAVGEGGVAAADHDDAGGGGIVGPGEGEGEGGLLGRQKSREEHRKKRHYYKRKNLCFHNRKSSRADMPLFQEANYVGKRKNARRK